MLFRSEATVAQLFADPRHPYTRGLMASIPVVPVTGAAAAPQSETARLVEIPGMVPSLTNLPPGCAFAPRCALADARCHSDFPPLMDLGAGHRAACWRAGETTAVTR